MACTPLEHSDYKISTNHWGLERRRGFELERCEKCGLPEFRTWWQQIAWLSKDREYWKRIYREAETKTGFFLKFEPKGRWAYGDVYVDGDEEIDPAKLLAPRQPTYWRAKNLVDEIRVHRYHVRRPQPKEHDYGWRQPFIDGEVRRMCDDLDDGCIDNVRFAAVGSRKDMRRYRARAERGCCGRHDEEVSVFGKKFMIGCNYGH